MNVSAHNSYASTQSAYYKSDAARQGVIQRAQQSAVQTQQVAKDEYVPSSSQADKWTYDEKTIQENRLKLVQDRQGSVKFNMNTEPTGEFKFNFKEGEEPINVKGPIIEYEEDKEYHLSALKDGGVTTKQKYSDYSESILGVEAGQMYQLSKNEDTAKAYLATAQEQKTAIDERIGQMLAESGIALNEEETLNLEVSLDGSIVVGEGIADEEKAAAIESVLAADDTLGRELLRNYAQQGLATNRPSVFDTDAVYSRIVASEVLQNELGISLDDVGYEAETHTYFDKTGTHNLEEIVARDFTVRMGLYNNVPDNSFIRGTGKTFESASAMSVGMRIEL